MVQINLSSTVLSAVGSPILFDAPIGIDQHQHARGTDEALAPNP